MKERPILFSGPMILALLAGTKTQTRRAVRPNPAPPLQFGGGLSWHLEGGVFRPAGTIGHLTVAEKMGLRCPYGQPGDRLWVRESFAHVYRGNGEPEFRSPDDVVYMADGFGVDRDVYGNWKPSIHMPRWASRILLEITDVRVERLQDISEADAIAEGLTQTASGSWLPGPCDHPEWAYHQLWDQINGAGSWGANPWVWAVSFRRLP